MELKKPLIAGTFAVALGVAGMFVAPEEGISLKPYRDSVDIWTVCRGHTRTVNRNKVYTEAECEALFRSDLWTAMKGVLARVNQPLPDRSLAAFTSFVFNVGESKFAGSTMLKLINKGDLKGACKQLPRWKFAGGQDCSVRANNCYGVWKRRLAEQELCLSGLSGAQS